MRNLQQEKQRMEELTEQLRCEENSNKWDYHTGVVLHLVGKKV